MPAFDSGELAGLRRWAHAILTRHRETEIFQTSTMGALLNGVYEGDLTIRELLRHGDFGLGTFNRLDGEMLVLDGVCYQLRSDGSATVADADERTPFAAVTWFHPERRIDITTPCDRAALKSIIDANLDSANLMVAVRVRGHFSTVRTRTVSEQRPPYRPFTEATQDQREVTFTDVTGTLAGFRMPNYEQGISVAGYHSHFIDEDRRRGGHTLDYQLVRGTVEIAIRSELHLSLQHTQGFLGADLDQADVDSQIRQTEG
ncbi:acetolactate decarboxylase [Mycobacterium intermedium]|uniref:Alpha-acetolactate decarboxylase n=1 Tax=Mycobacterium intermedium TaxID=28445 RepID=A0A1E3SFK9_MYCIE|nr:acetolactate decarboxylase [Mycobacterium intermedium]MCV6966193.1 acetolactate decarboxylase [Mycobacterium intermedium]ODR00921.1 alpha-acetolactate decarboxylase [Mycobacterium intermedium]OPE48777.1 acetolactate decarboxylase [Mycobacterium intermedium]ORB09814.1 acetolactate decarboxylase [Mycobacterium intermedium]